MPANGDEVYRELDCEFHGPFPRHLMICPKCYEKYQKRNKEILYEQSIRSRKKEDGAL